MHPIFNAFTKDCVLLNTLVACGPRGILEYFYEIRALEANSWS